MGLPNWTILDALREIVRQQELAKRKLSSLTLADLLAPPPSATPPFQRLSSLGGNVRNNASLQAAALGSLLGGSSLLGTLGAKTTKKHKVFVSYHHNNDQFYRDVFEKLFSDHYDITISKSVQIGDISPYLQTETIRQKIRDEYLRDSTVTVVLIGSATWQRKHVDWEISSSIRNTEKNPRSGLLGILLPTYQYPKPNHYNPYTIPPRLYDNIQCGFAKIYNWDNNPQNVQNWVNEAFNRRTKMEPDNSYPSFVNNKAAERWTP